ncbi:hypothetical protein [Arthrobacter sp. NPDC058192]|uniref:hypothetical protein n=1 Tax=Arthrobacter sp. NPDC058192 TaxID=3346372 RepID=UPI0036ED693E
MRRRIGPLLRTAATRPLFLAQVFTSVSGACAMVMAAYFLEPRQFAEFALLNLAAVTLVGLVRAFLFQPALIQYRHDKQALVPFRYALGGAFIAGILLAVSALLFAAAYWTWLLVLAVSGMFPILHDWLRYRAMALDRRWDVAISDLARLVLVSGSPLVFLLNADPVFYQAYLGLSLVLPMLYLRIRLPVLQSFTPLRSYLKPASLQLADYVAGQFNSTVPLMVLGGLGASYLIGGVRFAQTLLGPLNLVFAASTVNLIADGASKETHADTGDLIRQGRRLARMLGALACSWVLALIMLAWQGGFELGGLRNEQLLIGLILVGTLTLGSGWAGIHAIVLRLLRRQGTVTLGRIVLVAITATAFITGYHLGGTDLSLAAGFVAGALASPLTFGIPAHLTYRSLLRRQDALLRADPQEGAALEQIR